MGRHRPATKKEGKGRDRAEQEPKSRQVKEEQEPKSRQTKEEQEAKSRSGCLITGERSGPYETYIQGKRTEQDLEITVQLESREEIVNMKIAIVTGASSGMGREAVVQLANRFAGLGEIWVIARRTERLEQLRRRVPVPLRVLGLDLTDEDSIESLRWELRHRMPEVKILVNAAGYGRAGKAGAGDMARETGMIRLNCEALCGVTHAVLPYMSDHGRILMFASAAGFLPQPEFAIYAATKAFVVSFGRALNRELRARDIVVTSVCPGPVDTEFFTTADMDGKLPFYKRMSMAKPERVVRRAIGDSMLGKEMSVYGPFMKLFCVGCKLIPHSLILSGMEWGLRGQRKRE